MNIAELKNSYGSACIGVVARIISDTELIISTDSSLLHLGDNIQVYYHGEDIFSPDGQNLGSYNRVKDTLQVIQLEPQYIIAKKEQTSSTPLSDLVTSPLLIKRTIPLCVDQNEIRPLSPVDMKIHVGDPVKLS